MRHRLALQDWQSFALRAIYAIVEDLLKATGHQEDCRIQMSDAEVITTELVAARFFNGNQSNACQYLLNII